MKQKLRLMGLLCPKNSHYRIKPPFFLTAVYTIMCLYAHAQRPESSGPVLRGIITDTTGAAIAGVTIGIKGTSTKTFTDDDGRFTLRSAEPSGTLVVSYVGHQVINEKFGDGNDGFFHFYLVPNENILDEVEVNTGYQNLAKHNTTGSIHVIDSAAFNRSNSPNFLDRLDGISSGLVFNRNKTQGQQSDIIIRGRSTIFGDDKPLIVIDNFPYEGELSAINPNDIQQISILKDAAASSIWGTRAGNGVIVITTKKGARQSRMNVQGNANVTVGRRPDFSKTNWFPVADWLEVEQYLYDRGAFNYTLSTGYSPVSPAVEVMHRAKSGVISREDSLIAMQLFKQADIRNDLAKHLNQTPVSQQYAVDINGGGAESTYFLSAGLDRKVPAQTGNNTQRVTLHANNTYHMMDDALELSSSLLFTNTREHQLLNAYTPFAPYEQLMDADGNHLAVTQSEVRQAYADTAGGGALLDWHYRPLDELVPDTRSDNNLIRLNNRIAYAINKRLSASVLYQYQHGTSNRESVYSENRFYTRNLINRFTSVNEETKEASYAVPRGAVAELSNTVQKAHYGRLQLDYHYKSSNGKNEFNALAGFEIRDELNRSDRNRLYGYNEETGVNGNSIINFNVFYPQYVNPLSTARVPEGSAGGYTADRYRSLFFNASYTLLSRYTVTASARKDESNLFGVKPNQRGVPLWSAGLLWRLSEERFYKISWLPVTRIRASYGYSGNISKTTTAYLTANAASYRNQWGAPFNEITNPPNPSLGWEKVQNINLSIEMATRRQRIALLVEPYWKKGMNLIGESPLAPQVGLLTFVSNSASTASRGIDITLTTRNLEKTLRWHTHFLLSHNQDKVTSYVAQVGTNFSVIRQSYNNPIVGNPFFSIYGFGWGGLDGDGNPLIYTGDNAGTDYAMAKNSTDRGDLQFIGSTVPTTFGSIRNTLRYKNVELSFNLLYRLGYYFRRPSLNNQMVYGTLGFMYYDDYTLRWQQPGDELTTDVPALVYPANANRNDVYTYSETLVVRGDNLRVQDIRLSWDINRSFGYSGGAKLIQAFLYIHNPGYLWKRNGHGLDPDNPNPTITRLPAAATAAVGLKVQF